MPEDRKTVLYIDDEPYYTKNYRDELARNGWAIDYFDLLSTASHRIHESPEKYAAIILDLMMPRPEDMDDRKWEEFIAMPGAYFLHCFRDTIQRNRIPIYVLSNRYPHDFQELCDTGKFKPIPREAIEIKQKLEISAINLPQSLEQHVHRSEHLDW